MSFPLPAQEEPRLARLRSLRILDTLPEAEYDDLAAVVGTLMDAQYAYISLVDVDRLWYKAKAGFDLCEAPREGAICAHTILQSEPLVVSDLREDPRFADSPFVTGPMALRFYAGAPLIVEGQAVGTLCCVDATPRTPTPRTVETLAALARQASALLTARLRAAHFEERERQFNAFFDHAPVAAFLKDAGGRMRYVNPTFLHSFGREAAGVLGLRDEEWLPQTQADECRLSDEAVRRAGHPLKIEERLPYADGKLHHWHTDKFTVEIGEETWIGGMAVDLTELREAEAKVREQAAELEARNLELSEALAEAEALGEAARTAAARFEQLFAGLPVACYTFDAEGTIHDWNGSAEALWGVPVHEAFLSPVVGTAVGEAHAATQADLIRRVFAGETVRDQERQETLRDGRIRWILTSTIPLLNGAGEAIGAVSANTDVTERRESKDRFRTVVESLHEGLLVQNDQGKFVLWNRSAERVLGVTGEHLEAYVAGVSRWESVREDGTPFPDAEHPIARALATGEGQESVVIGLHHPAGDVRWISVNAAPLMPDADGRPTAAVASFLDVTAQRQHARTVEEQMARNTEYAVAMEMQTYELEQANARLQALATTDGLTGLRNHRFFQETLKRAIESGEPLAIALLDVDRFKAYNDDFGHQEGDAVLRGVARCLERSFREGDLVARYGGEEFVVVMPNTDADVAMALAEEARWALSEWTFDRRPVTASFGVAILGADLRDAPAMIRAADEALYASKAAGRNRVTLWSTVGVAV